MRWLVVALLLGAAGCGGGAEEPRTSGTCASTEAQFRDYPDDAPGAATREEAAAEWMNDGDRLVREGPQPLHQSRDWQVVTEDDQVRAVLAFWKPRDEWLVTKVELCPDRGPIRPLG